MRTAGSWARPKARLVALLGLGALMGVGSWIHVASSAASAKPAKDDVLAQGREIFNREWIPGDSRSHGGDGLGPVYNDTSCVACHNLGGAGGAGPVSKNIDMLSASRNGGNPVNFIVNTPVQDAKAQPSPQVAGLVQVTQGATGPQLNGEPLFEIHAGFRSARTVVLHRFGTDPNYQAWRRGVLAGPQLAPQQAVALASATVQGVPSLPNGANPFSLDGAAVAIEPSGTTTTVTELSVPLRVLGGRSGGSADVLASMQEVQNSGAAARLQEVRSSMDSSMGMRTQMNAGAFLVSRSQRNPTPLFGLGLIDRIPEKSIEEGAKRRFEKFPEVQGRVSRLKNGRVGRLGWKGQTANTDDFVLTACAVELGLEVPGHEQAMSPQAPKYRAGGMDLTGDECASLVAYVKNLPRPLERASTAVEESKVITAGKTLFASVGCATCHAPSLGGVDGIYSDLLLHDMGTELADSGSGYGSSGDDDNDPLNPILENPKALAANAAGAPGAARADRPANRQEWRTPPLWGVRDSGPYLHDGRAQTFEQAVAGHGGQGAAAAQRFFELTPKERLQIETFLKSLVAPDSGSDDVNAG